MQFGLEMLPEPQGDIGILCGIGYCVGNGHTIKGDGGFAGPKQGFDRNRFVIQVTLRQDIHTMVMLACVQGIGHQHSVIDRGYINAIAMEDLGVIFHVLADLQHRGILEHRLQHFEGLFQWHLPLSQTFATKEIVASLFMGERDVAGGARFDTKRHTHQIYNHGIQPGGFGIYRHIATLIGLVDPLLQAWGIADTLIFLSIKSHGNGGFGRSRTARGADLWNSWSLTPQLIRHAFGQGAELHICEEAQQHFWIWIQNFQVFKGEIQLHGAIQLHQSFGHLDLVTFLNQSLAPLGLFDLFGAIQ